MDIKVDLAPAVGIWGTIKSLVNAAEDIVKWYGYAKQFLPMMKVPFVNLLISFKKVSAEAHAIAAKTDNPIDDKVADVFDSAMDGLLAFFHCKDDYERMAALDKAAEPKQ